MRPAPITVTLEFMSRVDRSSTIHIKEFLVEDRARARRPNGGGRYVVPRSSLDRRRPVESTISPFTVMPLRVCEPRVPSDTEPTFS